MRDGVVVCPSCARAAHTWRSSLALTRLAAGAAARVPGVRRMRTGKARHTKRHNQTTRAQHRTPHARARQKRLRGLGAFAGASSSLVAGMVGLELPQRSRAPVVRAPTPFRHPYQPAARTPEPQKRTVRSVCLLSLPFQLDSAGLRLLHPRVQCVRTARCHARPKTWARQHGARLHRARVSLEGRELKAARQRLASSPRCLPRRRAHAARGPASARAAAQVCARLNAP